MCGVAGSSGSGSFTRPPTEVSAGAAVIPRFNGSRIDFQVHSLVVGRL